MGCDIHMVVERRKLGGSKWVGLWASDAIPGRRLKIAQRDYGFFTEIAGVRGRSDTTVWPRNIPEDVSRLAWLLYMSAPTDHHSPSYASPAEFCAAYLRANPSAPDVRAEHAEYDLLGISGHPENVEHRVVFWFDN